MDDQALIERAALDFIERYRSSAAPFARELAEIAEKRHRCVLSAETWRDIADAIERFSIKP